VQMEIDAERATNFSQLADAAANLISFSHSLGLTSEHILNYFIIMSA